MVARPTSTSPPRFGPEGLRALIRSLAPRLCLRVRLRGVSTREMWVCPVGGSLLMVLALSQRHGFCSYNAFAKSFSTCFQFYMGLGIISKRCNLRQEGRPSGSNIGEKGNSGFGWIKSHILQQPLDWEA